MPILCTGWLGSTGSGIIEVASSCRSEQYIRWFCANVKLHGSPVLFVIRIDKADRKKVRDAVEAVLLCRPYRYARILT